MDLLGTSDDDEEEGRENPRDRRAQKYWKMKMIRTSSSPHGTTTLNLTKKCLKIMCTKSTRTGRKRRDNNRCHAHSGTAWGIPSTQPPLANDTEAQTSEASREDELGFILTEEDYRAILMRLNEVMAWIWNPNCNAQYPMDPSSDTDQKSVAIYWFSSALWARTDGLINNDYLDRRSCVREIKKSILELWDLLGIDGKGKDVRDARQKKCYVSNFISELDIVKEALYPLYDSFQQDEEEHHFFWPLDAFPLCQAAGLADGSVGGNDLGVWTKVGSDKLDEYTKYSAHMVDCVHKTAEELGEHCLSREEDSHRDDYKLALLRRAQVLDYNEQTWSGSQVQLRELRRKSGK